MQLDVYGASDVGCVRELNEDSFCVYGFEQNRAPGFCVLSDGMGGHNAGEVASQRTVQFVAEELMEYIPHESEVSLPKCLNQAVHSANKKIYNMAMENQNQRGMGATLVAACICERETYIANVGDSRAYACRDHALVQITRDHSVVEEMVANGSITREEARVHPQKNIITRAVGTDPVTEPDIFEYDCMPGDCLLLCSDGLSTMVEDAEILEILEQGDDAEHTVTQLIETAKKYGGNDNVTVICIRFIQEG
ncbi:Stp1/IreP family PP2C-type Ser/Thr phosphatase [Ructibacterium gallinarum]|uniref:Stp1/IreP family PP2C-type Ser/Thr phosphatase n=1 Tax=Ructibacterium gallinarum TaxID=2779355 RepID=A0A9D5LZU0_9FIRM|nr:Stp1/IreP family PP2C-type Ser/Thr phosphatase [Ructibacterium gallinarum]MBE5039546.1 Stp1/IreP family PP2C-type Ser/Thr phosphatase [Ructibacterium gallinarum]